MIKKLRPTQITQLTTKCRFMRPRRFAVIDNTRQDEKQNQISITNNNNIHNPMSIC